MVNTWHFDIMAAWDIAVLTVSDTCSKDASQDRSGPVLTQFCQETFPGCTIEAAIAADEVAAIVAKIQEWCDVSKKNLILTSGGTGFSPRDVTPEAVGPLLQKTAPGFVAAMLHGSLSVTPMAAVARPVAGIRGETIIVCMPGSPKACRECAGFIAKPLRHALDALNQRDDHVAKTHVDMKQNIHTGCNCGGRNDAVEAPVDITSLDSVSIADRPGTESVLAP